MAWAKKNWRLVLLNGGAFVIALRLIPGFFDPEHLHPVFNASFEASGLWAIRFLLFSLAMTPLNTLFGWRSAITLRKSAGLSAFGFALMHGLFHILTARLELQAFLSLEYLIFGVVAISILSLLAVTSNRWAMKWLGKTWKRLHRLVYIAGGLVAVHAIIAFSNSKKSVIGNSGGTPNLQNELTLYLALMVLLLALRLPFVKQAIKFIQTKRTRSRALPAQ
jgi:methionine sulfoxide reductase heme-binding subunit